MPGCGLWRRTQPFNLFHHRLQVGGVVFSRPSAGSLAISFTTDTRSVGSSAIGRPGSNRSICFTTDSRSVGSSRWPSSDTRGKKLIRKGGIVPCHAGETWVTARPCAGGTVIRGLKSVPTAAPVGVLPGSACGAGQPKNHRFPRHGAGGERNRRSTVASPLIIGSPGNGAGGEQEESAGRPLADESSPPPARGRGWAERVRARV